MYVQEALDDSKRVLHSEVIMRIRVREMEKRAARLQFSAANHVTYHQDMAMVTDR
jgi:hypothetical protein